MKNLLRYCFCAIFFIGVSFPLHAQMAETKIPDYILQEPSGPLDFKKQPFDVLDYKTFLDLTKAPSKVMFGLCSLKLRWTENPIGKKFHFHLRSLNVDTVFLNDIENDIKITALPVGNPNDADFHYEIDAPISANQGDTTEYSIYYSGTMTAEYPTSSWGGVQNDGGSLYALGVGFSNEYVSATRHWMPCYDHPPDKARLELGIRTTRQKIAVSNGISRYGFTDSLHYWRSFDECATYLMTFAVDNYTPLNFKSIGRINNEKRFMSSP